jgi:hypothetical protein
VKLALLLLLTGCTTISWTCPVPATVTLEDTRTVVKCPSSGKSVTIEHPVKP